MKKQAPSIFNDVIGPVMRGPSSSHVAAAARIGALVREAVNGTAAHVTVEFDINGSLAETHDGQGTDMGLSCGILGIPLTDHRVDRYIQLLKEAGTEIEYRILDYGAEHPNFYRIYAEAKSGKRAAIDAISTGGGMIEMVCLQGYEVSILGDYYESCYMTSKDVLAALEKEEPLEGFLKRTLEAFQMVSVSEKEEKVCIDVRFSRALNEKEKAELDKLFLPEEQFHFTPVLPTHSLADCAVPFCSGAEMLAYNKDKHLEMWELAEIYESVRGGTSREAVFQQMTELVALMEQAAKAGLAGTVYEDRILHAQAYHMTEEEKKARLVPGSVMNSVIQYITAIMEAKSAMEVIVAAPTAGSCGCLPGTLLGMEAALGKTREETVKGMLAAGLLGVFFAAGATFAAEVGGCQMECGAGSGMAAAGVAQMMGATAEECLDAASTALQAVTGLACDPVANRVEVPCLNKNIMGGMNALSSTNMILSGFDKVIPLDETIAAMYDIGLKLPNELRCTFGGLGKTKTSLEIRRKLEENLKS